MLARVRTAALWGLEAFPVDCEVDVGPGLPGFALVGLPDAAGREVRDRVWPALRNVGLSPPDRKVTVNLAPADRRKEGSSADLAVALGVLAATEQVPHAKLAHAAAIGEVALDGALRPVRGTLSLAEAAWRAGASELLCPAAAAPEAALVGELVVRPVGTLEQVVAWARGVAEPPRQSPAPPDRAEADDADLAEVRGLAVARRALEIAAAGGHHLLLVGTPGCGKTMLAQRLPGLLPPLAEPDALVVTRLHSAAGFGLSSPVAGTWTMFAYVDATNAIPTESNEWNNATASPTVTWTSGNVTVSGTLAYDDMSYTSAPPVNNRPMRCVMVELWDSDVGQGSADDLLATTITNASGQFAFATVSNLDEADLGRQDIYLKAYFRSEAACLGNAAVEMVDASGATWAYLSGTYQDIASGTVNLGTLKPTDYGRRSALNIYDAVLRGYDWAMAHGGTALHPWYVKVQWQQNIFTETFYVYQDATIRIAGAPSTNPGDLRPNEWDNNAIYHEYAHHLAYLFGFDDPAIGGTHAANMQARCGSAPCGPLAWSEGCSHFLSCLIQNPVSSVRQNTETNAGWTSTHVYEMDLETGILTYGGLSQGVINDQGWTWETPVAGTLWDIYDSALDNQNGDACDDAFADGITRIWDVLTNHPGQTITDIGLFYTLYCQRYGSSQVLDKVLCEHGMTTAGCAVVGMDERSDSALPLMLTCGPNPTRERATLSFSLPTGAESVQLRIYDVAGRRVRDLMDQALSAGRHAVPWDGRGQDGMAVRSGLYFCRLTTPAGTKTTSVLIVR